MQQSNISENSRRIARNTLMLYFRMLLMLFIGLFTSRVILRTLGIDDYGIYNVVGGVVTMFTIVTTSISSAIVRYITFTLGENDSSKLHRVFSTSVYIQLILCAVVVLLTETLGVWYLNSRMVIPAGRLGAANWVLQSSMAILVFNLLAVPYNACITAHEKMGAYAGISIIEAVLKLSVALALYFSPADKLKTYAVLMAVVALAVRSIYAGYSRRNFAETGGVLVFDSSLLRQMSGFAGWNFFGSGAYLVNTQGVNILSNAFFGVGVNAARGVALQVENIVKQFVSNILTAVNPQITKSYASGNNDYCFELVCKASKYAYLVILLFAVPLMFEADMLLYLWLGKEVPGAALFTRLTLLGLMADMVCNPLLTLTLATGRIRNYYLITSAIALLAFPVSWICFKAGMPAYVAYVVFAVVYLLVDVAKLLIAHSLCSFPVSSFIREVIARGVAVTVPTVAAASLAWALVPQGWARLLAVLSAGTLAMLASSYYFALTPGERSFIKTKLPCRSKENA